MSVSPKHMAESLQKAAKRRVALTHITDVKQVESGEFMFRVHDNDGGILTVAVWQYKKPLR